MRLLWSIEHSLQRTSKSMQASLGITGPQRLVLLIVSRAPGISPSELAHVVRLHPSTITGVLQRLERKKLLGRTPDPADSRRTHLYVLKRGRAIAGRVHGTVESAVGNALKHVGPVKLESARYVLSAIATTLEAQSERG